MTCAPRTFDVVLLRHGAVDAGGCCYGQRHDVPLTAAGLAQAAAAAARLGDGAPVVTSPAGRARSTAAAFGGTPAVDARWAERDFGAWEARPWTECWAEAPEALAGVDAYVAFRPPGAESVEDVAGRVAEALEGLSCTTVVVTHGGPIRLALRHVLGLTYEQAFAFRPEPGTVTRLVRHGGAWSVRCVGACPGTVGAGRAGRQRVWER